MKYKTGMEPIDDLIGGYEDEIITEFYGPNSSGKTTLSAYVPIVSIYDTLKEEGKISEDTVFILIDGDGGFDEERAFQVWSNLGDAGDIKSHLKLRRPTKFDEQHKLIKGLKSDIKDNDWEPAVVTFDPMTAIYRGIVTRAKPKYRANTIQKYTGKLDLQLTYINEIAKDFSCPAIVSSWPSSSMGDAIREEGNEPEVPMIGGRAYGFLPKVIVELECIEGQFSPLRKAKIYKHRSKAPGTEERFELCDTGIKEVE